MSPFSEAFGLRVNLARRKAELTQTQLAEALGLTRSSVANIEGGRQGVYTEMALRIADAVNVSVHWLMTGCGECAAPPPNLVVPKRLLRSLAEQMKFAVGEIESTLEKS